jgi:5-methylcytosine-specific restriction enzyme A
MLPEYIQFEKNPAQSAKEKQKARELRQTQWWKNEIAKGICHYCQRQFPPRELTMDHIVPIARGGRSIRGNVAPCCKQCNTEKKCLTPVERILNEIKGAEGKKE